MPAPAPILDSTVPHRYGKKSALAPGTARPARNAGSNRIPSSPRTFLRNHEDQPTPPFAIGRNAALMHDFVAMPEYVHLLITAGAGTSIEKALQFIKGGFSG